MCNGVELTHVAVLVSEAAHKAAFRLGYPTHQLEAVVYFVLGSDVFCFINIARLSFKRLRAHSFLDHAIPVADNITSFRAQTTPSSSSLAYAYIEGAVWARD